MFRPLISLEHSIIYLIHVLISVSVAIPSDATSPTPTTSSEVTQPTTTTSAASPAPTPTPITTIAPPVSEDTIEVVNVVMNNMENYLPTDVEDVEAR